MQVTSQVIVDGSRNLVVHLTGDSEDGAGENQVTKVDIAALASPCSSLRIDKIIFALKDGGVRLLWDADVPVEFALLAGQNEHCFERGQGLNNNAGPSANGNILLSTIGFDVGSTYDITLEMTKKGI